jgi:eukaryotic-like serine/threonine-protein kinase
MLEGCCMIGADLPPAPEKWQRLREIHAQAMDVPPEQRFALALRLCEGDSELESQLRSLLSAHDEVGSFLCEPAIAALDIMTCSQATPELKPGIVLAKRFKVQRFLNRGGMGEVYEAWDSELCEMVALKTIRPEIASDPTVIERFKGEVKQARQIAHPNICRVYDLFSHGDPPSERIWFLTMQLLEGRTLSERLRQEGAVSTGEALMLIEQMIAGLTAAHELGIIHRDFKSANIMLVPGAGKVPRPVITDFGLATRILKADSDSSRFRGQGTPVYAAPEQLRKGIVGSAGDQYSLGIVICEMITGKRPTSVSFESDQPSPIELPVDTPLKGRWKAVISRCLEIEPENRFGSLTEILTELSPRRRHSPVLRWLIAVGCLPLLVTAALLVPTTVDRKPTIRNLKQLTPAMDLSTSPSISRDGKIIAYASDRSGSGSSDIWVQHLPDGAPTRVTSDSAGADDPSLSPDGRIVVYTARRDRAGIYISNVDGGGEKLLVPGGRSPRFSPNGHFVLYWTGDDNQSMPSGRIYVIDPAGGTPVQLAVEFADARDAIWNSDGRHILFKGCPTSSSVPACWDWWVTTIDGETPRDTKVLAMLAERKMVPMGEFGGWYGNTVLFNAARGREVHLWEVVVSPLSAVVTGEPRELTPGDAREEVISSSLANDNVLALTDLSSAIHVWRIDHVTAPEHTKAYRVTGDADMDLDPYISNDGRWLTFARGLSADRDLWVRDTLSGKETVFPAAGSDKFSPVIDETGSTLAYETWEGGVPSVILARIGGGQPARICVGCRTPTGWFNGKTGLLLSDASNTQVEMFRLDTGHFQSVLNKQGAFVTGATWSPANHYVLFSVSADHQNGQIFAARFAPGASLPDPHWIAITNPTESAQIPRWSGDGKTVYYLSNRDNSLCVWGRHFDSSIGRPVGAPFAVQHFHNQRFSLSGITSHSFNLSAARDSVYLNVAEMSGTIWIGKLDRATYPFRVSKFW